MEADYEGFSIREYTRRKRSVEIRKCWPFAGDVTGDFIHSILPPITVAKFRWWSHELAKAPVTPVDDSEQSFKRKSKTKSKLCKKRSVVEIHSAREGDDFEVLICSKRKRTNDSLVPKIVKSKKFKDSGDRKIANKVNICKELARNLVDDDGKCFGITRNNKTGRDQDSEFWSHGISKETQKMGSVRSPDESRVCAPECEGHVRFSNETEIISRLKQNLCSVEELCRLNLSQLSLSLSQDQSFGNYKETKAISSDQTIGDMQWEQNKFRREASERWLSHHAREKSGLSSFPGTHFSLQETVMGHLSQPIQSFTSMSNESPYRSCSSSSQPVSAAMHCGTLLHHSTFDPLLVECMQRSVSYRQRHVEEPILGFPLNSQETDNLLWNSVEFSSGKMHSIEPGLAKDGVGKLPVNNEKRHNYFPARLGIDETFTDTSNDAECCQALYSPVSEVSLMSNNTVNSSKQDALNQNLLSRNVVANLGDLCLHDTQATMRLMGKDVFVDTSYSDMVRTGERIIAPNSSVDDSFASSHTHRNWQCQRTAAFEISQNHSTTSLYDTSKDPFPRFCEPHISFAAQARTADVHDSVFPPTILHPCGSLVSCPLTDLSFHGFGLEQQPNSFTNSQQQLPFPSNYNNVDIGFLPDSRKQSFGLPFSRTDSTRQPHPSRPPYSYESSCSGMPFIDPIEQLVSLYGSSYIDIGIANKQR